MKLLPFLLAIVMSKAISHASLSKLSEELLSEGLVSLDEDDTPTAICMTTNKSGSSTKQLCPMTTGFGPRSVGCFAVWNHTTVIQMGCYSNQEVALRSQCKKRKCSADRKHKGVAFCCCYGALCNAEYD